MAFGALLVGEFTRGEAERVSDTEEMALDLLPESGDAEDEVRIGWLSLLTSIEHDLGGVCESRSAVRERKLDPRVQSKKAS